MSYPISPEREQQRQDYLEWLYERSGRTNGLYTGLFQRRVAELVEADMEHLLDHRERSAR